MVLHQQGATRNRANQKGLTLIEILVVISIVGLMAALLVPAIQFAREASRRIACTNNLKQIGLGLSSYASAYGAFPGSIGQYSPLARILPYIDQLPVYNSINFESPETNNSLLNVTIGVFLCPSDAKSSSGAGMTNYSVNGGTLDVGNAPFSHHRNLQFIGYQHIIDGTSATALGAECLSGVRFGIRDPFRSVFESHPALIRPDQFSSFLDNCHNLNTETSKLNGIFKGETWVTPEYGSNLYNHALTPNDHSCTNGTLTFYGAWTAGSLHGGGVNVLFADSHIVHMKSTVSRATWQAIGTMNGREVVEDIK